jgi:hypothetical protein
MADQLQLRGGSTAQTAAFTGALREVTVDTDKKTVVVHDGTTAGGNPLLRQDLSNLPAGTIDNADINASAGIVDTKLATIATAGKVSNSATTATSANTNSAIVARDASGNFTAGTITAALTGAASSNVLKAGDTMTGNLTVPSLNGGPLAGFRNRIINGNFDIWQRGTSHSTNGYGSADRWNNAIIGSACTMSRQPFTLGQTDVPGEPLYFCRMAVTSVAGAGNRANLQQRIEDVRTFAGQQVTVSFWAKADAAKPISVELIQDFGSGGSPSTDVETIGTTKTTLSTSWQKVTVTATVPSISGKTLGTNPDSWLQFNIWFDAGSDLNARTDSLGQQSGTFDIAQVQIEPGTVATPFEQRPIGTELALCQRYFEKSYPIASALGAVTTLGGWESVSFDATNFYDFGRLKFTTRKRATPTISLWSTNGTAGALFNVSTAANQGNSRASNISDTGAHLDCSNAAMTTNNAFRTHWAASAEL